MRLVRLTFVAAILLLAGQARVDGQITGGGILGGGGGNLPMRVSTPIAWWDASQQYCWTDAACQFTAADKSRLRIADASQTGLDIGTDDYLWTFWIYVDSANVSSDLILKSSTAGYELVLGTNRRLTFYHGDSTGYVSASPATVIALATWTHIAVHVDRSGVATFYFNGVDDATTLNVSSKAGNGDNSVALSIGAGTYHFDGRIDSLMFFTKADLSAVADDIISWAYNAGAGRLCSEISDVQKTAWGAISGWELGEAAGTRYDEWGSNHLDQAFVELTTNGTFTGNSTGWSLGANWAYGTNNIAATAADADATQALTATVGKLYSTSFALGGTPSGSVRLEFGGANLTTRSTAATHTETLRATAAGTHLAISPVATFTGTIDTVSVMAAEILPAPGIVRGQCADGGDISYWTDRSGTGNHALMTTLAKRPAWVSVGGVGTRPAVMFDGVDDYLQSTFTLSQPFTVFAVGKFGANSQAMLDGVSATTHLIRDAGGLTEINAGTELDGDSVADTDFHVLSAVFNGASSIVEVDGTPQTGAAGANNAGGITLGILSDATTAPLDGRIAAVIVYPVALTDPQRAAVTTWLQSVYDLAP